MNFSWTLALRYLQPKRTYLSIITLVSIMGVALGVGVLIVVVSVMSGYEKRIKEVFLSLDNHITLYEHDPWELQDPRSEPSASSWRIAREKMKRLPGVTSVEPMVAVTTLIEKKVMVDGELPKPEVALLLGISPDDTEQVKKFTKLMVEGEFDISGSRVVISQPLADRMGITLGSRISGEEMQEVLEGDAPLQGSGGSAAPETLLPVTPSLPAEGADLAPAEGVEIPMEEEPPAVPAEEPATNEAPIVPITPEAQPEFPLLNAFGPENIKEVRRTWKAWQDARNNKDEQKRLEDSMDKLLVPSEYEVAGILKSESPEGNVLVVMNLDEAQVLDGKSTTDQISGLAVQIEDPVNADGFLKKIQNQIPAGWHGMSWSDKHRNFLDAVQSERGMMIVVLAFITLVAAFSIMNSILTFAVQKRKEIGMMRALGAKVSQIAHLFLAKGMVVGLVGTALGTSLGLIFLHFRNEIRDFLAKVFNINILDPAVYGLEKIPASVNPMDLILISSIAFVLCSLAALPPVFVVARQDPAKALRSER